MRPPRSPGPTERAQVAGIEAVPFGFLILVVATLMITSAWTVIDAKLGVTTASREGARAFVESADDAPAARNAAQQRAAEALRAFGGDTNANVGVTVGPDAIGSACGQVTVTVTRAVPMISLPWIGGLVGSIDATSSHTELLDPYRSDGVCP